MDLTANILDDIHSDLDPTVFDKPGSDKPKLKPAHRKWIISNVKRILDEAGYHNVDEWLSLVLTGSLTTYQYSPESDVDISLFVDAEHFPEWSRAEMIGVMVSHMDGTKLPGTTHVMQGFVVGDGITKDSLYQPGLRSGYDLDKDEWIVPPERDRIHDVEAEYNGWYTYALETADKMERLLKYEPRKATQYWHMIHRARQRDQRAGKGDYSASNIIYKFLANQGLFPEISEATGEYIASAGEPSKDELHVALQIPDSVKKQIKSWVDEQDWPEGTELENPADYHVTLLYAHEGYSQHGDSDWVQDHPACDLKVSGIDEFGDNEKAIVLLLESEGAKDAADELQEEAEDHGLEVSRFPGGYKPHMTIAKGSLPEGIKAPDLKFKTLPSEVSDPRISRAANDPAQELIDMLTGPNLSPPAPKPKPEPKPEVDPIPWQQRAKGQFDHLFNKYEPDRYNAEMVPVDYLKQFQEFNRRPGASSLRGDHEEADPEYWDMLKNHIQEHGYHGPLGLEYDPDNGVGYMGEGNHRLQIAEELGHTHVPVRVHRRQNIPESRPWAPRVAEPGTGIGDFNYAPDSWAPSQLGIPIQPDEKVGAIQHRQVAKFVYHSPTNRLLVGQMGDEEGQNLTHAQLANQLGILPEEMWAGQFDNNGRGEHLLRGKHNLEGRNQYEVQHKVEKALTNELGTSFKNYSEVPLNPKWNDVSDPAIMYAGEKPALNQDNSGESKDDWDFLTSSLS